MSDQEESRSATETVSRRRRRRQRVPVEEVSAPSSVHSRSENDGSRLRRWQRWRREVFPNLGVSPIFRAYIFLGSIAAILAFLLYNESIIAELREHEKSRVDLYAHLISFVPLASDEQISTIFTEVITKVDFPRIITNHRGEIIQARGIDVSAYDDSPGVVGSFLAGLAFWRDEEAVLVDTSKVSAVELQRLIEEMDAQNPPIAFYWSQQTSGFLHNNVDWVVITDNQGQIVKWQGAGLPASGDTTTAALIQVQLALQGMGTARPLAFTVPAAGFSYLHWDGANVVIVDDEGAVKAWRGAELPAGGELTEEVVARVGDFIDRIANGREPLAFRIPAEHYIHYGSTDLVGRISLASLVQIGVLLLFLLVGYIGYRNIKRSEQRSIWVGMAKETAHQLGTPLSSLSGWLELIRHEIEGAAREGSDKAVGRIDSMVGEMQQDMRQLDQIAARFSQIGSVPELKEEDVAAVLEETINYFRHRGPQFGRHDIEMERLDDLPPIPINAKLMSWAFENLFKNAIDAMERQTGSVRIRVGLLAETRAVQIMFQDDGRGIEPENIKRIFEPGFSTKKRGWGLGLAFVKRIIEEYHKGKINVVQSAPGAGTTFEVILPLGQSAS